jgi:hypothetical protein
LGEEVPGVHVAAHEEAEEEPAAGVCGNKIRVCGCVLEDSRGGGGGQPACRWGKQSRRLIQGMTRI